MAAQYSSQNQVDNELLMRLKELRTSIAVRKKSPAYFVFPDKTLIELDTKFPTTMDEMESIYGVGITKSKQYGPAFLDEIVHYLNERNSDRATNGDIPAESRRMNSGVNDMQISVSPVTFEPIEIENFDEIRQKLDYYLDFYRNAAYTPENLQQALADRTNLNRLKKALTVKRKEIKDTCLEPFRSVEFQFKELISMIDAPLTSIAEFAEEMEQVRKDEKCAEIKLFYDHNARKLGPIANDIFSKPWFYDKKWENKTCKEQQWKRDIRIRIDNAVQDLQSIKNASGPHTAAVIAKYVETGSKIEAAHYLRTITDIAAAEETKLLASPLVEPVRPEDPPSGVTDLPLFHAPDNRASESSTVIQNTDTASINLTDEVLQHEYVFKIRLNEKQYQLLTTFMELSNIQYDIIS